MSKLDDIYNYTVGHDEYTMGDKETAKQQIKDLFKELIGEDAVALKRDGWDEARRAQNDYRQWLRQKVDEL